MIYRVKHDKDNPYFLLNRSACEDERLSFKAVGIHTYLMSKPDEWALQETDIARRHTGGTASVRAGLKELKDTGYLKAVPVRAADGTILQWETHIFEISSSAKTHNVENPHCGEPTLWKIAPIVSNNSLVNNDSLVSSSSAGASDVYFFYQQNITQMPTEYELEQLGDLIDTYTAEKVLAACKIAVEQNVRRLAYVNGILKNPNGNRKNKQAEQGPTGWDDPEYVARVVKEQGEFEPVDPSEITF